MLKHRPSNQPEGAQARSYRFRYLWLTGVLCLVFAALLVFSNPFIYAEEKKDGSAAEGPPPGMPVEAASVEVSSVSRDISAVGTLQSDESVVITAEIAGRVLDFAFEEGQQVNAGEVLVQLDDSILRAELDRAKARLELSQANYHRAELLLKDNAISRRERDEAYAQWKLDEANLRLAQANLDKTVLHAPFSGVLGLRRISPGSYLRPGDPVVSLDAVDPIKLDFRVPEVYARQVRPGQSLSITVDAVPGETFPGTISAIDPQLDPQGRSILIRARVENDRKRLSPGMFARVSLELESRTEALLVPEEALIAQGKQPMVFKVVEGKVVAAPVKTGLRQRGRVEILEGLQPGDTVITAGHIKVQPGMPVMVLPATAQKQSTEKQES